MPEECRRLEAAIRRLLEDHDGWRLRAREAEQRVAELETALRELSSGALDPLALSAEVERLGEHNLELRQSLDEARAQVRRIMARLDFLKEEV